MRDKAGDKGIDREGDKMGDKGIDREGNKLGDRMGDIVSERQSLEQILQPNSNDSSKFRSPTSLHVWAACLTRGNSMADKFGDTAVDKMGDKVV